MKPVHQRKILLAQPRNTPEYLMNALKAEGAKPTHLPTMDITPLACELPWQDDGIATYAIVSSQHAAASFAKVHQHYITVIAVGPTTAKALNDLGIQVAHTAPPPYGTEALMRLPIWPLPTPHHLGIFCGQGCGKKLKGNLVEQGMSPQMIDCYRRTPCQPPPEHFWTTPFDAIICLSGDNLKALNQMLPTTQTPQQSTPLFVITEPMTLAAQNDGWHTVITMPEPTPESIIKSLSNYFKEKTSL